MSRKFISEQSLVTDRWISFDPLDNEIIEKLFKKDIWEGEEKLMLAVLADAIEHFQRYALSKDQKGRKLFQEAEEWFLAKDSDALFSFEYICEILQLRPNCIHKGLLAWMEARCRIGSPEEKHRVGRRKSANAGSPVKLSKTA
jgi:hypothetical protein